MRSQKNRKLILILIFALIALSIGMTVWWLAIRSESVTTFKEVEVVRGDLEVFVQANGSVQPENRLVVKPQIAGRIDAVLVEEGSRVSAGQSLAWMSSNDRAALIDMAKSAGTEELKRWEEIYKPTPIFAPLGGIVISKQVERGQTVSVNDSLFVISDRLIVLAQVDETDLAKIKLNQRVELRVDAYGNEPAFGRVIRIAYESKLVNNVTIYEIRILPEKIPPFMRAGMTVTAKFIEEKKNNVLLAPVSFLNPKMPGSSNNSGAEKVPERNSSELNSAEVWVKSTDPKVPFVRSKIVTGSSNGRLVEIVSGLDEGASLVFPEEQSSDDKKASNPFSPFGGSRSRRR